MVITVDCQRACRPERPRETILPFEQKYSADVREQSLARVLQRRESEPGNRAIIRETAVEFAVGEQSLRSWLRAHERARNPEPIASLESGSSADAAPDLVSTSAVSSPPRRPGTPDPSPAERIAELEAEIVRLRRDREALKSAMAVVLVD
jgi:transposase-like protein